MRQSEPLFPNLSSGCAGAKRLALQHVVRRKPIGAGVGTSSQPSSEQPQKRHKADPGSVARNVDQDAAARRDDDDAANKGTERAADNGADPGADPVQSDAATRSGEHDGAQAHSSEPAENAVDGGGGSAGLTALLGDYGSDSDG